ncbi:MAG TPA: Rieske 2Fe-2S domain-containing protein [Polyangiaceae bacterium]|jgi:toluene monooxygenase system ferredoxin subunit|nr:Rieske 2Fe-2S domain-containing protein [Polyangiaceae bacterium]
MSYQAVASAESLWPGEMSGVVVGRVKVLLVNVEGTVHAYENRCAHQGQELSRGRLDGQVLTCWAHEWRYDACTGKGINPERALLRRFPVKIENGRIYVDVDNGSSSRQA